ncbi:hydrogenase maturation nickel metallochaperone HypA/HybF [Teredinibacter purpureus]|uniref:hydrogenase maturation nickel metallochaperone HypA/HybF n=1 Tax=Teredinibacter purpureus TaxID=2731756 RepID=UPI0005F77F33|nr:hydrogenase maturation nickel metallochaperone HypA [Teredinibacter purpureus]
MHEFSVCKNILHEAQKMAALQCRNNPEYDTQQSIAIITGLTVKIGLLAGIDKNLLQRAFPIALHDHHRYCPITLEQGNKQVSDEQRNGEIDFLPTTTLIVEEVPALIYCHDCGCEATINQDRFQRHYLCCDKQASHQTQLLSGEEMHLVNITLNIQYNPPTFSAHQDSRNAQKENPHV